MCLVAKVCFSIALCRVALFRFVFSWYVLAEAVRYHVARAKIFKKC